MLGIVAFGLLVSGVTVWPAVWGLKTAVRIAWGDGAPTGVLHPFVLLPACWFLIDAAFAPAAALPLWLALLAIRRIEKKDQRF